MKAHISLFTDEAGWIVAECLELPGCFAQGRSRAEALANIEDAIQGWLYVERQKTQDGEPLPLVIEIAEIEVAA